MDRYTVSELRKELQTRGLPTSGNKSELWNRFTQSDKRYGRLKRKGVFKKSKSRKGSSSRKKSTLKRKRQTKRSSRKTKIGRPKRASPIGKRSTTTTSAASDMFARFLEKQGSREFILKTMRFIQQRHPTFSCFTEARDSQGQIHDFSLQVICRARLPCQLYYNSSIVEAIRSCSSRARFSFGFVSLHTTRGLHANIFLLDEENKTIERFDPHGGQASEGQGKEIDKLLEEFTRALGYTYIPPNLACPRIGIQAEQSTQLRKRPGKVPTKGFCSVWTAWYLDQRLIHPELSSNQVQEMLLRQRLDLTDFIQQFGIWLIHETGL